MFKAPVMTFIESCRHNILQLVEILHLYMKGLYDLYWMLTF